MNVSLGAGSKTPLISTGITDISNPGGDTGYGERLPEPNGKGRQPEKCTQTAEQTLS